VLCGLGLLVLLDLGGCTSYRGPGLGLSSHELLETQVIGDEAAPNLQPAARLPVRMVLVRMQRAGYPTLNEPCRGAGRYCVLTVRDVESDAELARIAELPQVASLIPLPARLIPKTIRSVSDLRRSMITERIGDLALFYSIDTQSPPPSTQGSLDRWRQSLLSPSSVTLRSRVSATLIDIRTGFVYLQGEVELREELSGGMAWSRPEYADRARQATEGRAFSAMTRYIEQHWSEVIAPLAWRRD
jgi:hypothetical protein